MVKLITCNDIGWTHGGVPQKPQVGEYAMDRKHCGTTKCSISGSIDNVCICTFIEGMCHSSIHPPYVQIRPYM